MDGHDNEHSEKLLNFNLQDTDNYSREESGNFQQEQPNFQEFQPNQLQSVSQVQNPNTLKDQNSLQNQNVVQNQSSFQTPNSGPNHMLNAAVLRASIFNQIRQPSSSGNSQYDYNLQQHYYN